MSTQLRETGSDKRLCFTDAVLCPDLVDRLGLWVDPCRVEVVQRDESLNVVRREATTVTGETYRLDSLENLLLGVKLSLGLCV
jgi:hypothetical protein